MYERDPAVARKILARSNLQEIVGNTGSRLPRSWFEALIARAQGDEPKAQEAFAAAREKTEAKAARSSGQWNFGGAAGSHRDAGLQRKPEAIAEGLRAVELRPLSSDAVDGATVLLNVAMIYAWVGDVKFLRSERLIALSKMPGGPDYGQLKFDPRLGCGPPRSAVYQDAQSAPARFRPPLGCAWDPSLGRDSFRNFIFSNSRKF